MAALSRWDPIREATTLRDAMGQLFEQAVMAPGFVGLGATGVGGQMNILEADGRYHCQILLPGVSPDAIELTGRQNTLTVTAKVPETLPEDVRKNATYLLREFGAGEFSRSVTLPKDVDGNKIEAHYDRGILTIVVPLAQHAQPKRIAIREASPSATQPTQFVEEKTPTSEPAHIN